MDEDNKTSKYVHIARPIEPQHQEISEAAKLKHARSVEAFPELNLSRGEHVILCIMKHKVSLVGPMGACIFVLALTFTLIMNMDVTLKIIEIMGFPEVQTGELYSILGWAMILTLVVAYIIYYTYSHNRFILTNESVIQEIQKGILHRNEQTVSLANIEDASYTQRGLFQQMFNYGSIRLSTEGDETTYRFNYVSDPKAKIATLNNAVEAFKNGRPVDFD